MTASILRADRKDEINPPIIQKTISATELRYFPTLHCIARGAELEKLMHGFDESDRHKDWGEILEGELPCGQDASLDHEFDLLHEEIGKEESLHSHQKTDWTTVYALADSLLLRSKDLWPFAYGIVAVYYTRSAGSCAKCINNLVGLLTEQWQFLYPSLKRPKRRIAPLKWMCDKFHSIADNTAFLNLTPAEIGSAPVCRQTRKASFCAGRLDSLVLPPKQRRCLTKYHGKLGHYPEISELDTAFTGLQEKIDSLLPENVLTFRSILSKQLGSGQHVAHDSDTAAVAAQSELSKSAGKAAPHPIRKPLDETEKNVIIPPAALPPCYQGHKRQCPAIR